MVRLQTARRPDFGRLDCRIASTLDFPFDSVTIQKVLNRERFMSILKVSIRQIKAARSMLDWSQVDLAVASGISEPTIKRLEAGDGELKGRSSTIDAIVGALTGAGVVFIEQNGGGPGVRLTSGQYKDNG